MRNINSQSIALEEQEVETPFESLETYKALIKASGIGAWQYFYETEFLWCNEACFLMLGRNINKYDLSGNKNLNAVWTDLLHPEDVQTATERLTGYLQKPEGVYEDHYRMQHINGKWIWIWSRGSLVPGSSETQPALVGTYVNITRRKEAEETTQQERLLLRTLIENIPNAVYVKDREGRFLLCNTPVAISAGRSTPEEVIGKTDFDFYPKEAAERFFADEQAVMGAGQSLINFEEYYIDKKTNEQQWNLSTKVPFKDKTGKVIGLLGVNNNITKRKQSEEILNRLNHDLLAKSEELSRQAEDLKILNAALAKQKEQELEKAVAQGKFEIASEVLHDIGNAMVGLGSHLNRINRAVEQNNLDSIKSLTAFLKGQQTAIAGAIGENKAGALVAIVEGIATTQVDNETDIRKSITELLNIITHIQEILSIQRQLVREHTGVHERKAVNLADIIDNCRSMLFASLEKKAIQLKVNIKPGKYVVKGDHTKLMQVMLNILKNSVEAIDADTAKKNITVEMKKTGEAIELIVADNGTGFSDETASKLFARGFTTKKNGTGLGLYNCRLVVESHGGTMDIKSDGTGQGSVTLIKFSA